jgi:hypothetical protein
MTRCQGGELHPSVGKKGAAADEERGLEPEAGSLGMRAASGRLLRARCKRPCCRAATRGADANAAIVSPGAVTIQRFGENHVVGAG